MGATSVKAELTKVVGVSRHAGEAPEVGRPPVGRVTRSGDRATTRGDRATTSGDCATTGVAAEAAAGLQTKAEPAAVALDSGPPRNEATMQAPPSVKAELANGCGTVSRPGHHAGELSEAGRPPVGPVERETGHTGETGPQREETAPQREETGPQRVETGHNEWRPCHNARRPSHNAWRLRHNAWRPGHNAYAIEPAAPAAAEPSDGQKTKPEPAPVALDSGPPRNEATMAAESHQTTCRSRLPAMADVLISRPRPAHPATATRGLVLPRHLGRAWEFAETLPSKPQWWQGCDATFSSLAVCSPDRPATVRITRLDLSADFRNQQAPCSTPRMRYNCLGARANGSRGADPRAGKPLAPGAVRFEDDVP